MDASAGIKGFRAKNLKDSSSNVDIFCELPVSLPGQC
jgi:hypothetical protein